jgi:copper chaperone NosL
MCAFCKMAISQKRYAAELVEGGGNVFKFDDIGCMIHFAKQRGWIGHPPARFVHDYDSTEWLEAGRASFVLSPEIPSPMASGLLAVRDPVSAERYAARFHGRVRSLGDLWK